MDMAPVERADAAGCMNAIIVANGDDLASHASKAVIVGYLSEDHGAALDFVDMGLGGNDCLGGFRGEVVQYNPSFARLCTVYVQGVLQAPCWSANRSGGLFL